VSQTTTVFTRSAARDLDRANVDAAQAQAVEAHAGARSANARAELDEIEVARQRALVGEELRRSRVETARLEAQIKAREAKAKADARAAEKARAAAAKAAARAERWAWLGAHRDLLMTVLVIAASMGIAWPAQATYFMTAGMGWLGLAVPLVVEGPQWLSAALSARAVKSGAPGWVFWTFQAVTCVFAAVAASINYAHGSLHSPLLGVIYALASLTGMVAWELYVLSSGTHVADQSAEERRRDRGRRKAFPAEWKLAENLRHAVAGLDVEAAWAMAWRSLHGAEPGVTAELLKLQNFAITAVTQATGALLPAVSTGTLMERSVPSAEAALRRLEELGWIFPYTAPTAFTIGPVAVQDQPAEARPANAGTRGQKTKKKAGQPVQPPSPRGRRKNAKTHQTPAARKAAADTARAAQTDPLGAAAERLAAAQMYAELKAAGERISYQDLGKRFSKSKGWAFAAVRDHAEVIAADLARQNGLQAAA
jgi:hypothetical protein